MPVGRGAAPTMGASAGGGIAAPPVGNGSSCPNRGSASRRGGLVDIHVLLHPLSKGREPSPTPCNRGCLLCFTRSLRCCTGKVISRFGWPLPRVQPPRRRICHRRRLRGSPRGRVSHAHDGINCCLCLRRVARALHSHVTHLVRHCCWSSLLGCTVSHSEDVNWWGGRRITPSLQGASAKWGSSLLLCYSLKGYALPTLRFAKYSRPHLLW